MAVPSDLTATLIVTEAFTKAGNSSPSTAEKTRAEAYHLREILNDIWTRRDENGNPVKYKILQTWSIENSIIGTSKYAFDADFDDEISISFLTGTHTGTAQAGTSTTITLEDAEDAAVTDVEGKFILITGGTGVGGFRQVTDYNTTTYVATIVGGAWTTNPSSDSTYRIINTITDLDEDSTIGLGTYGSSYGTGNPSVYARITEDNTDYFITDKPPSASTYGFLIRFYSNPNALDLTSTVMTRIYNNWQNALTVGTAMKIAENDDDNKYAAFTVKYEKAVAQLIAKETPASGEFRGFKL